MSLTTAQELPVEKKPEEITQETPEEQKQQEDIYEKNAESEIGKPARQLIYKPLIYVILILLISFFFIPLFMKAFFSKTKVVIKVAPGTSFFENFKSYNNGEFIDGKLHWVSSDEYQAKGWRVEDAGTFKFIHFHPSPWPGGFRLGSNYATYHASFSGKINSLQLEIKYSILPNSEMKVYISGNNENWIDVTEDIGMHRSSIEGEWKKVNADLKTYLAQASIEKEVYLKFTSAAYSGSGWGALVSEVKVTATFNKEMQ